jgi:exosortase
MHAPAEPVVAETPSAARRTAARIDQRALALGLVGLELLLLYTPTVVWLYGRWTMSVWHNAHGLFVGPLVGWLIHQELKTRPEFRHEPGSALGFIVLVPALLLNALDAGMHTQLLSAISLVAALPGLSLLFLGTKRTVAILFPLAFSLFAIPIPLALTESIHMVLRTITAVATAAVLHWTGYSVLLEGTTLQLAAGSLNVVDACSGFSTLYAALALACLAAYTASSTRRKVMVLAAATPLAILSNIVRITGLSVLVSHYGFGVLHTFIHPLSGLLTFFVTLPLILKLGGPPRRREAA